MSEQGNDNEVVVSFVQLADHAYVGAFTLDVYDPIVAPQLLKANRTRPSDDGDVVTAIRAN